MLHHRGEARLRRLIRYVWSAPLPLILVAIASLGMIAPALLAQWRAEYATSRTFAYAAILGFSGAVLISIAYGRHRRGGTTDHTLGGVLLSVLLLPPLLAVPLHESLRETGVHITLFDAWFEMVSCLTTTGVRVWDSSLLSPVFHLWRGMVGWMGGGLVWYAAGSVLAFRPHGALRGLSPNALILLYVIATMLLVLFLMMAGDPMLTAWLHAMAVMATSGISAGEGFVDAPSGTSGEVVASIFLLFALTQPAFAARPGTKVLKRLGNNAELRAGLTLSLAAAVIATAGVFFNRSGSDAAFAGWQAVVGEAWGHFFTFLNAVSTTGFASGAWAHGGAAAAGTALMLMILCIIGGGVGTTAGGIKLGRILALVRHSSFELAHLACPSRVHPAKEVSRTDQQLAVVAAWVVCMLAAISIAFAAVLLAMLGMGFESALILSVAAHTTTGPLMMLADGAYGPLAELALIAKLVLAAAMLLGRLEILAVVALISASMRRV